VARGKNRKRFPSQGNDAPALAEKVIAHCPAVDSLKKPMPVSGAIGINNQVQIVQ